MENKFSRNFISLLTCFLLLSCSNNQINNDTNVVNSSLSQSNNNTKHREETKIATDVAHQKQKPILEKDNLIQK